jgi:DNA mismatch repair protein MutL
MARIQVLGETIASQIAAGEVVERPASVVKELVENSLDAGASRVDIEVEAGGADRIRVSDDGSGMDREDAVLAFERHATSKIRSAEDLRSIDSFGFRGEALPSIASVSRITLTTSTGGTGGGTRVRARAGVILGEEPVPHPRGTTVEVEALFHNAPARRKFLRSRSTEAAHIAEVVARIAAAHPHVSFTLKSGGRELASWPSVASPLDRVAQILGRDVAMSFVGIERREGALRVTGLASGPALSRSTSREQVLFVNRRPIRDRRLLHALQEAYATLLPRGRYPVVYLFLEVPPGEVDVNVHPTKSEVRFLHAGAMHDLVREAILQGLGTTRPFYALRDAPHEVAEPGAPGTAWTGREGALRALQTGSDSPGAATPLRPDPDEATTALFDSVALAPLAQFRDSYILASAPDGLVILDQHAAHERILYESLMVQSRAGEVLRQRLLFPVTVDLPPAERQAFDEASGALEQLGFGCAPFGEGTLIVDEVPALMGSIPVDRLVREILGEVLEWRKAEGIDRLLHHVAATAACHAAVTARHPLGPGQMGRIVADLLKTEKPMTCPHGRPVLLRLSLDQIEKEFHRR